jgi:hypothetical protein
MILKEYYIILCYVIVYIYVLVAFKQFEQYSTDHILFAHLCEIIICKLEAFSYT